MGIPHPGRAGGPPTHLPYLVDYFSSRDGFVIRTFYYGGASDGELTSLQRIGHTLATWGRFMRLLMVFRPDIVHLNTAFDPKTVLRDVPFSLTCLILRKKLFLKLHGSLTEMICTKSPVWRLLNRAVLAGAVKTGVLSSPEKEEFIREYGHPDKFVVVKNIVLNKPVNKANPTPFSRTAGITAALYAGRLIPEKGLDDVLRAVPMIIDQAGKFILVIAGDGPEMENSRALADKLGISDAVRWLGLIGNDSLNRLIPETDFLIFASRMPEGMPMTVLDAMKNGLPVITTPVRFARDYMKEPDHCLFVEAGNPASIAAAAIRMINDKGLREKMTGNYPGFIDRFSKETVGREFEELYYEMTGKGTHKKREQA